MFAFLLDNNLTQISTVNLCHVIFDNFDCKQKPDSVDFVICFSAVPVNSLSFLRLNRIAQFFNDCNKLYNINHLFVQRHAKRQLCECDQLCIGTWNNIYFKSLCTFFSFLINGIKTSMLS